MFRILLLPCTDSRDPSLRRADRARAGGGTRVRRIFAATVLIVAGLVFGREVLVQAQGTRYSGPRTPDGKPDLNGIWQVMNSAHWDLEAHSAADGIPGGLGVVEGGTIPYQP